MSVATYCVLIFLALLSSGYSHYSKHEYKQPGWHPIRCRHHSCRHKHDHDNDWKPHWETDFDSHAKHLKDIDSKFQEYCKKNHNEGIKIVFGTDYYRIIIPLSDFNEDNIKVKTKYRMLSITAKNEASKKFSELRVLPDVINYSRTTWCFKDQVLEIRAPYKLKFDEEIESTCDGDFDDKEVIVPKGSDSSCNCNPQYSGSDCLNDYVTPRAE